MTRPDGQERAVIRETYKRMLPGSVFAMPSASSLRHARSFSVLLQCPRFNRDLIQHIESETSGNLKNILVAVLKCTHPKASVDYDKDCENLKKAMDGIGTNETAIIQIVAGKTPQQIETLKEKYQEKFGEDLFARIDNETWDWGMSMFMTPNFRACMLGLMRSLAE